MARMAAIAMSGTEAKSDSSWGVMLLEDIKINFTEQNESQLPSKLICSQLAEMEGRPWAESGRGKRAITPTQLSSLLKPFGIGPENIRLGTEVSKGYKLQGVRETFDRYLGPPPSDEVSLKTNTSKDSNGPLPPRYTVKTQRGERES
jgi:hypothetical protein